MKGGGQRTKEILPFLFFHLQFYLASWSSWQSIIYVRLIWIEVSPKVSVTLVGYVTGATTNGGSHG